MTHDGINCFRCGEEAKRKKIARPTGPFHVRAGERKEKSRFSVDLAFREVICESSGRSSVFGPERG